MYKNAFFWLGRKSRGSKWENGRRREFKSDACYVQRFIGPNSTSSKARMLFGCVIHTCSLLFKPIWGTHTFVKKTNKSKTQKSRKLIKMWARPRDSIFFFFAVAFSQIFKLKAWRPPRVNYCPGNWEKMRGNKLVLGPASLKKSMPRFAYNLGLFFSGQSLIYLWISEHYVKKPYLLTNKNCFERTWCKQSLNPLTCLTWVTMDLK